MESHSSNSESAKASNCETNNSDSNLEDRRHKESKSKKLSIQDLEELICQKNDFCEDHNKHCHIMVTKGMEGHHVILNHCRWENGSVYKPPTELDFEVQDILSQQALS